MIGLALDTSYLHASVALIKDDKILYYKNNEKQNKQAETINLAIEEGLSSIERTFKDLEYVAVTVGPGRFTGLRVGISVANAIKFALGVPLISISNFKAIAHHYKKEKMGIILEAGVGKFYFQSFDGENISSDITVIQKEEVEKLRERYYLIGNVEIADEEFYLDARHAAYYAERQSKDETILESHYLQPQYIINNYIN